ncbi:sugar ABC transporter substrate-binding protein [Archangium violaceum]|uniref:ABC transporter substrate-binding protein n=1 Tax=Archangium violaceum TaxID=83451 RepID=UPI00194F54A8|nr:sugar ABC transporter substrate-binding protein [Archangium violaceum]QRN97938.1 sugar ABC transporter substrate-binding protein [Archangium violaceum]
MRSTSRIRTVGVLAALMFLAPACKRDSTEAKGPEAPPAGGAASGVKIALLLPESKTARYETHDRPHFERKVKELCANCEILYSNADQDASKQQNQAEAALTNGAKVLVLDPVDSASAAAIVTRARQSKVPVLSYERLILNADVDYYISFDNEKVGKLQAQALLDKLKADGKGSGSIVIINGSPTDNNAKLFKAGAHSVLDGSGLQVGAEYDTPDWSPDKAQQQMEQAITSLGKDKIVGVYAANDGTAGGAIAAMKAAGVSPLPPVTGQDAELAAIQRILSGEQFMTVYKAIKAEGEIAAEVAVALARGNPLPPGRVNGKVNNGAKDVPSILLPAQVVTKDNVKSTVVADGFWTTAQICEGSYASACASAQLTP